MREGEVVIRIAGSAGDGVASVGDTLSKLASRSGLGVCAYNSYQSVLEEVLYGFKLGYQTIRFTPMATTPIYLFLLTNRSTKGIKIVFYQMVSLFTMRTRLR